MKLYRYVCGDIEKYGPAEDETDAYNRRERVDHTFLFLPLTIEELKVDGHEIEVKPLNTVPNDREGLKAWLTERSIEFTPQWGAEKLRETALQHVS